MEAPVSRRSSVGRHLVQGESRLGDVLDGDHVILTGQHWSAATRTLVGSFHVPSHSRSRYVVPTSPALASTARPRAHGQRGTPHITRRSAEFLGEPDEKSFGPPDVAEPIHVLVLDDFANELRAELAEPGERIVDVVHGEHDA
jgi:hypothetical protein